ncbi:MAG: DUF2637 domain-containing protein [Hamadaea sp.]|nr:DUF2637 domain-containing protein [Hamadaea sp.]
MTETPDRYPDGNAPQPAGAVSAIRAARQWPVFKPDKRSNFWINTLLTIVAIAASYGAALGQAGFAELYLGMHGPERYVVFLIIEATAVALMLLANQTALAGDSAGGLWTLVWIVTAGAVTMQIVHANAIGQPEAAMVYATASVLTVVLWRAKTRRSLRDRLRAAGMIEDPLPRYRPVRWVLRPRETFRAWYLALGEGVSDPATAMDMARADRLYHRSAKTAREALTRARRARQPLPDLTDQQHVVPPWRVTHPDARRFGVLPWHQHTPAQLAAPKATAPVQATPLPPTQGVRPQPPVQRPARPIEQRPPSDREEPLLPAPMPAFSAPDVFEPPISVPPPFSAPPQPERPVSAVPAELFRELREQISSPRDIREQTSSPREIRDQIPSPLAAATARTQGPLRQAVFDALDRIITDADEGLRRGEIIGALVDQFPDEAPEQLERFFDLYTEEASMGRRPRRATVG